MIVALICQNLVPGCLQQALLLLENDILPSSILVGVVDEDNLHAALPARDRLNSSAISLRSASASTNTARKNMYGLIALPPKLAANKPWKNALTYITSNPLDKRYDCVARSLQGSLLRRIVAIRKDLKMFRTIMK